MPPVASSSAAARRAHAPPLACTRRWPACPQLTAHDQASGAAPSTAGVLTRCPAAAASSNARRRTVGAARPPATRLCSRSPAQAPRRRLAPGGSLSRPSPQSRARGPAESSRVGSAGVRAGPVRRAGPRRSTAHRSDAAGPASSGGGSAPNAATRPTAGAARVAAPGAAGRCDPARRSRNSREPSLPTCSGCQGHASARKGHPDHAAGTCR